MPNSITCKCYWHNFKYFTEQTAYIDVCDDTDYSWRAKGFHEQAKSAGVPAITTAGIYPGVSNVMAAELVNAARSQNDGEPERLRLEFVIIYPKQMSNYSVFKNGGCRINFLCCHIVIRLLPIICPLS